LKACAWGVIKMMKALLEIPEDERNSCVQNALETGSALLLDRNPVIADYPSEDGVRPIWFQFDFPISY